MHRWCPAATAHLLIQPQHYLHRDHLVTELSNKLDPKRFLRIHRSSIVNLDQIREVYREGQTDASVVLLSGRRLKMSKTGRQKLVEIGKA